jgi:poly(3-hydroxybutyrate) depolymerase
VNSVDISQDQNYNYWIGNLGDSCPTLSTTSPLCEAQGNISAVTEKDATSCRNNTEVIFYKLSGGTHAWYNTPMNVAGQVPYNPNLNSSSGVVTDDVLWIHLLSHRKS